MKYKLNRISNSVLFINLYDHNELIKLINKSKIVIVIYSSDTISNLDIFRINILLSNKVFIIHEMVNNKYYEEFKNHITFTNYNDFPKTCLKYLQMSQEERDTKCEETYKWIKDNYSFNKLIPYKFISNLINK